MTTPDDRLRVAAAEVVQAWQAVAADFSFTTGDREGYRALAVALAKLRLELGASRGLTL